jgi:hypothetical protein
MPHFLSHPLDTVTPMSYTDTITQDTLTPPSTIDDATAIDWTALGLQVETVFDGTGEGCPCCGTDAPLSLAA